MSKKFILSILTVVFGVTMLVAASLSNVNFTNTKTSQAQAVYTCGSGEQLTAGNTCVSNKTAYPIFGLKCPAGYTPSDAVCTKGTQLTCADYPFSVNAANGLCKISDVVKVLESFVQDEDGRQCGGTGYNFKKYSVNSFSAVVCANTYSAVAGKENFRFVPFSVNQIANLEVTQTSTEYSPCAPNAVSALTTCTSPAIVTGCSQTGEYLNSNVCVPCPINKYCDSSMTTTSTQSTCPAGGRLLGGDCVADLKFSYTDYTTGCAAEYVKLDQTCAIFETRTHDLACSYFYVSNDALKKAILDTDGNHCVTNGGNFTSVSIVKVSDLQCDGPGTAWYNYNVAFDPLVCGNNFTLTGAAGFRWLADTFIKITPLQKLPFQNKACPAGWTEVSANSNDCKRPPVIIIFKEPKDCPIGTTSPAGSVSINNCVTNPVSSSSSVTPSSSSSSIVSSSSSVTPVSSSSSVTPSSSSSSVVSSSSSSSVTPSSSSSSSRVAPSSSSSSMAVSSSSSVTPSSSSSSSSSVTPVSSSSSSVVSSSSSSSSSVTPSSSSSVTPSSSSSSIVSSSSSSSSVALTCSIKGKVYNDQNSNGIYDGSSEDILSNQLVSIKLYTNDAFTKDIGYNVNGNYQVDGLACTATYKIVIATSSLYTITVSRENGQATGSNPSILAANSSTSTIFDMGNDGINTNASTYIVPYFPQVNTNYYNSVTNNNTNINNNIFGNNNNVNNSVSNNNNSGFTSGYGYNYYPLVANTNLNSNNNNNSGFVIGSTIGTNTNSSNNNSVTNSVNNNNNGTSSNNNTNINNNILGSTGLSTTTVTSTGSTSNNNSTTVTNSTPVTTITTSTPNTTVVTNSNSNQNTDRTIRTGGLNFTVIGSVIASLSVVAFVYNNRRNKNLTSPIK